MKPTKSIMKKMFIAQSIEAEQFCLQPVTNKDACSTWATGAIAPCRQLTGAKEQDVPFCVKLFIIITKVQGIFQNLIY